MLIKKKITIAALLSLVFAFSAATTASASGGEYANIVRHLKTKYKAKKVHIPFVWLARFAVGVARPAGVKSFSLTLFEDLKFSRETLDAEMQSAMRKSFDANWTPIFHVRSRTGQQAYMYMREAGDSVKIALVTIDKTEAAIVRATLSPDRLAEFINDPKIFGISLNDNRAPKEDKTTEEKKDN